MVFEEWAKLPIMQLTKLQSIIRAQAQRVQEEEERATKPRGCLEKDRISNGDAGYYMKIIVPIGPILPFQIEP